MGEKFPGNLRSLNSTSRGLRGACAERASPLGPVRWSQAAASWLLTLRPQSGLGTAPLGGWALGAAPRPRLSPLPGRGGRGIRGGRRAKQTKQPAPCEQLLQAQGPLGSRRGPCLSQPRSLPPCAQFSLGQPALGGSPPAPRVLAFPTASSCCMCWVWSPDQPPGSTLASAQSSGHPGPRPSRAWQAQLRVRHQDPRTAGPPPARGTLCRGPRQAWAPWVPTAPSLCTEKEQQAKEGGQRGGGGRGPGLPRQPEPRVSVLTVSGPSKRQRREPRGCCPGNGRSQMCRLRIHCGKGVGAQGVDPGVQWPGWPGWVCAFLSVAPVLGEVPWWAQHLPLPQCHLSARPLCPDTWNAGAQ